MLFLPRYLGSEDYGRLYLAISLMMISHLIIDFGGGYFIPKEIARSRQAAPSVVMNSLGIRFLLWAVTFCSLILFSHFAEYPPVVHKLIIILGFATLWECVGKALKSCFQGFEKLEYSAIGAISERLAVTVVGVTALLWGADVIIIAVIMAGSTLLNALISAGLLKRLVPSFPRLDLRVGWSILKSGLPYFLWSVFAVVYYRIDAVMMSLMTPPHVVGWYGAAYRFFDVLMFIPTIFTTAVFPVMARLWKEETNTMGRTTGKCLELIITAGVLVSCCTFLYARQIISLFFGLDEYGQAVPLLQLFSVGLPLVYIDMILGTVILASDKQREWSLVALAAIPANIGLNFVLIPLTQRYFGNGGVGAAIATLLTEFGVMVAALWLIPKHLCGSMRLGVIIKAISIAPAICGVGILLDSMGFPWVVRAAAVVVTYIYSLHVLDVLDPDELSFIRDFFSAGNLRKMVMFRREVKA